MKLDVSSLAHTKWECKYHIVFAPKYRRQIMYGKIKQDIGQMIRKLCQYKGIEIHEAEACKDHIHMSLSRKAGNSLTRVALIIDTNRPTRYNYNIEFIESRCNDVLRKSCRF